MHEKLRIQVADACRELAKRELCDFDLGIVSLYDPVAGVIVIKPDGIPCADVTPESVLVAIPDGQILYGEGKLPREFATHAAIYDAQSMVHAIAASYPEYATIFAQAGRQIKPYGTLHAEFFGDAIPCTRKLIPSEIANDYETNLGRVIAETIGEEAHLLSEVGAVLVHAGGICTFGDTPMHAVRRMAAAEKAARLALYTELLQRGGAAGGTRMQEDLLRINFEKR